MAITIVGNGRTNYGPRITRDGLLLYLDAANTRKSSIGLRSLINWSNWTTGSGGVTGYNQNGQTIENERVSATNPWGNTAVVWESRPSGNGNDDGGWNTDWFNIDRTKLYRFSVWVRRTSSTSGGTFYLGMYANGDGSRRMDNSAVEGNAYWECSGTGILTQDQWYLWIGHVYPFDTALTGRHPDTGYYTITGGRVGNINGCNIGTGDLKWSSNSTQGIHRTYHYYCADNTTRLQFFQPRVDLCDGTEPTINQLLSDVGTTWFDITQNSKNGIIQNGTTFDLSSSGSVLFDGTNDQIATTITRGTLGNTMSIDAFFKYTGNSGDGYRPIIGGNDPGNATEFFLGKNTGNSNFGIQDGNYDGNFVTNYNVFDGNWHHMCYTYNNGTGRLYLDGVLRNSASFTKCNDAEQIYIGAEVQEGYWWKGNIAKVSYYTKVLSATEVLDNYKAHRSRFGLT